MKIDSIDINSSFTKFNDNQRIDFSKKDNNCIFIYGSNGTGKSSLSKLFSISNMKIDDNQDYKDRLSLLKTIDSEEEMSVSICYNDETYTIFTDDITNPKKIPVFNKDYINSKITYQSDFKNNRFQQQNSNYGIELESKKNYNNKLLEIEENKKKENYLLESIKSKIESGILQTIKDTRTTRANQRYNNEYNSERFLNLDPKTIPISNLGKLREKHIQYIEDLKDLTENDTVNFCINQFNNLEDFNYEEELIENVKNINATIQFNEDKSKLDFVKKYLDGFSEDEKNWKIEGAKLIQSDKCPFCEQNVANVDIVKMYRNYVNSSLKKVEDFLNKQKQYFDRLISDIKFNYEINETKLRNVDKIFNTEIENQVINYNKMLENFSRKVINLLENKLQKDNIYTDCTGILKPIDLQEVDNIIEDYHKLIGNIENINKKILKANAERKKANDVYLETTGKYIVYNMVRNDILEFKKMCKKSSELKKEEEELKRIYQEEVKNKNELLNTINSILDDFTITNYRVDENFDLFLNDCEVSKKAENLLSEGEKNIIAFALFVSELRLLYTEKEKTIIFIDDPITSVDYPNLYSIYNYIISIISENSNSQVIITSHNTIFLNLFKFHYKAKALYFKLKENTEEKTDIYEDTNEFDSIYLEKLKEIYNISNKNDISPRQKLYIHNYCRYVIETISRFEYPDHNCDSDSSIHYIKMLKEELKSGKSKLSITINNLDILGNIINKGSHATLEIVHDNEFFDDVHYIKCCDTIIEIVKNKYKGQYNLLTNQSKELICSKIDSSKKTVTN